MTNTLKNIYSDLDLTFSRIPGKNDVALSYDEQSVIRSVRNLLLTNFYERPFQPNLGSNLDKLLFEPVNNLTASLLENDIRNTITNYEPRVSLDYILISPNVDENAYTVTIQFYVGNNTSPTAVNLLLQRSR
jgi:phage baseplate assembly protein W